MCVESSYLAISFSFELFLNKILNHNRWFTGTSCNNNYIKQLPIQSFLAKHIGSLNCLILVPKTT